RDPLVTGVQTCALPISYTNQSLKWGVDSGQGGGDIGPGTGTTTHAWTDKWPLNAHAVSGANFKASTLAEFKLSASPSSRTVTAEIGRASWRERVGNAGG